MDVLALWPTLPMGTKQRAFRLLIHEIVVRRPTSSGSGQEHIARLEERVDIAWLR